MSYQIYTLSLYAVIACLLLPLLHSMYWHGQVFVLVTVKVSHCASLFTCWKIWFTGSTVDHGWGMSLWMKDTMAILHHWMAASQVVSQNVTRVCHIFNKLQRLFSCVAFYIDLFHNQVAITYEVLCTQFCTESLFELKLSILSHTEGYLIQPRLEVPIPEPYYIMSMLCHFYLRAPRLPLLFCPCCLHWEGRRGTVNFSYSIAQHSNLCNTFVSRRVTVECVIS